jgi:23S rRNA (cytidine1920-2'-O)/16S rRNA (cytidine1409-2'-O)-methyltransferase
LKRTVRLDVLLVERGLAPSRERARALVLAGAVTVNGQPVTKAGAAVSPDAEVSLLVPDHPYVSRGGLKLAHALDAFGINVAGRLALDIGASTGGFTDVLLQRGARQVVALDVGHGQLDWRLRNDPRVVVIERVNARNLVPSVLPPECRHFDLVTIDVSFISATLLLPSVRAVAPRAELLILVKPQFEVGRERVGKGGVVRDDADRTAAVERVRAAAAALGWVATGSADSRLPGPKGNREIFLHLVPAGADSDRTGPK